MKARLLKKFEEEIQALDKELKTAPPPKEKPKPKPPARKAPAKA